LDGTSSDFANGFVLLPRRWVVERMLCLAEPQSPSGKDFEAAAESAVT
jgi:hypothetical protein